MVDEPMQFILEALEDGPLLPAEIGAKARGALTNWRNALAACEALGFVSWCKPHWYIGASGKRWIHNARLRRAAKEPSPPAPARQRKDRNEGPSRSVGEEFAQARRRRRAI